MPNDPYNLQLRIAQVEDEVEKALQKAELLIPRSILQRFRRAFSPKGMPFFRFYIELKRINLGGPVPEGLRSMYRMAVNRLIQVTSPVDKRPLSPPIVNLIAEGRSEMNMLLGRLERGMAEDTQTWRKINNSYVPAIEEVAKDKGIYLKRLQRGVERWCIFRRMTGKQEYVEKLKDDDPEGYDLMQRYGQTLEQIDEGIRAKIEGQGMAVAKGFLAGTPVTLGVDPKTGEERVYDRDGEVLSKSDFIVKRRERTAAETHLAKVPTRTEVPLKRLRTMSNEQVDALPGDVEMAALTDDKAKQGRLTKILPVKWHNYLYKNDKDEWVSDRQQVIAGSRYKGIYLDDMVNGMGRLIEGTAYKYSPMAGREMKVPRKIDPSQREPYVSMAVTETKKRVKDKATGKSRTVRAKHDRLFLKINGTKDQKELRHALKKLACNVPPVRGCIPSVVHTPVKGSRAAGFYFEPKDFGVIMDSLQGMSLSKAALETVKDYYKDLANAEQATVEENLGNYSAKALGGFVESKKDPATGEMKSFDLLAKQKQALAWLDANGNKGVCALDTGVGKTLVSVAMMQKLMRDGMTEEDASYTDDKGKTVETNGRFLYVCPNSLKGNLPKEIRSFVRGDQSDLLERVDVISYREFSGASKSKKVPGSIKGVKFWKGRSWDTRLYVAIFFDEAHKLKNINSARSQAAIKLWHPHKICLTASPMEKNPMEAYALSAVSNNIPLFGKTGPPKENRKDMRRFKERFCETIGGRIIGVKQDPLVKRDMQTWVKRNVFYADKQDVEEFELPKLTQDPVAVEMDPEVEKAYRGITDQFSKIMKGLVAKFRDRGLNEEGPSARDPALEKVFGLAFRPIIKMMGTLANRPDDALREIAHMVETRTMPWKDKDGEYPPVPPLLYRVLTRWSKQFSPDELRAKADEMGNPKLNVASEMLKQKRGRVDADMEGGGRSLLFTDDKKLCMVTGEHMSRTMAGQHVVALNDNIYILGSSGPLSEITFQIDPDILEKLVRDPAERKAIMAETGGVSRIALPLHRRGRLRRYPMLPAHKQFNTHYRADNWQQFAFKEIVNPNPRIVTCTLYGPAYQYGHNLQAFDTVVHLDRDTWNSESMKQRTARAWRQGQDQPVDEITLDSTYAATDEGVPRDDFDRTLDEIRAYFQQMEGELFDNIIKQAQDVELGKEWLEMAKRDASLTQVDRKMLDLAVSPFVGRSSP